MNRTPCARNPHDSAAASATGWIGGPSKMTFGTSNLLLFFLVGCIMMRRKMTSRKGFVFPPDIQLYVYVPLGTHSCIHGCILADATHHEACIA
jgi:hypothetical protein